MADGYNEELVYDLRQRYADLVATHLERVAEARFNKNYTEYFQALEDLFVVIKHKFRNKKKSDEDEYTTSFIEVKEKKEKKEKISDLEQYEALRQKAIDTANKYETTFLGNNHNPTEIAVIEKTLREMEMFLWYVMDKAKMFGSVASNRGL